MLREVTLYKQFLSHLVFTATKVWLVFKMRSSGIKIRDNSSETLFVRHFGPGTMLIKSIDCRLVATNCPQSPFPHSL